MTLRFSFLKLMGQDGKRRIWTIILSLYLFITYVLDFASGGNGLLGMFLGSSSLLGPANLTVIRLSAVLAVVCGFQGFGYLFSSEKTDFYLSLPQKRSRLFLASYLNGILIFAVPCVAARLICCKIAAPYMDGESVACTFMGILISLLGFLLIYHLVILAVFLSGNLLVAAGLAGLVFFYGRLLFGTVIRMYSETFFHTFYKIELMDSLAAYLSPLSLYESLAGTDQYLDVGEWTISTQIPYLTVTLILLALTFVCIWILYDRRPAEAAGKAIAFDKFQPVLRNLIVIPLALMTGYFFHFLGGASGSVLWIAGGIVFGAFTFHGLVEVIFQFDIRAMVSRRLHMLVTAGISLAIAGTFFLDLWKYDDYLPQSNEVESVAVSVKGLDDTGTENELRDKDPKVDGMADSRFAHMKLTGDTKEEALSWIKELQAAKDRGRAISYVSVAYDMGNHVIYRRYPLMSTEQLDGFSGIYKSGEYRRGTISLLSYSQEDVEEGREFYWSNGASTCTLDLTREERLDLYELCREDLKGLTLEQVKKTAPLGTLTLAVEGISGGGSCYIYPDFEKTISFLKARGIPADLRIGDREIQKITVYHTVAGDPSSPFGAKPQVEKEEITDPREIQQIKEQLVFEKYAIQPLLQQGDWTREYVVQYSGNQGDTIERVSCIRLED